MREGQMKTQEDNKEEAKETMENRRTNTNPLYH